MADETTEQKQKDGARLYAEARDAYAAGDYALARARQVFAYGFSFSVLVGRGVMTYAECTYYEDYDKPGGASGELRQ